MGLNAVERDLIQRFDACATVKVDRAFGWVEIKDREDEELSAFLQGHEAEQFIEQADDFINTKGDVSVDEAYQMIGYGYLDLLLQ